MYAELKRALGRDPSAYQLGKLPTAKIQLSPSSGEDTVYLFPYCATSKLRKLRITGHRRNFNYEIHAMNVPASDGVWTQVYSDIGGQLFQETELHQAFDNVKIPLDEWVDSINGKRDLRRDGAGPKPPPPGTPTTASGSPTPGSSTPTSSTAPSPAAEAQSESHNRQQSILNAIIAERDAQLAAQQGISHLFF